MTQSFTLECQVVQLSKQNSSVRLEETAKIPAASPLILILNFTDTNQAKEYEVGGVYSVTIER